MYLKYSTFIQNILVIINFSSTIGQTIFKAVSFDPSFCDEDFYVPYVSLASNASNMRLGIKSALIFSKLDLTPAGIYARFRNRSLSHFIPSLQDNFRPILRRLLRYLLPHVCFFFQKKSHEKQKKLLENL